MTAEKRAAFEGRVQEAVERIVYGAKRRYTRRQESLDQTGIFHPEANAHRYVLKQAFFLLTRGKEEVKDMVKQGKTG